MSCCARRSTFLRCHVAETGCKSGIGRGGMEQESERGTCIAKAIASAVDTFCRYGIDLASYSFSCSAYAHIQPVKESSIIVQALQLDSDSVHVGSYHEVLSHPTKFPER